MEPVVLRFPRVDPPPDGLEFILLHVSRQGDEEGLLNVKLIGTDENAVFTVSLKDTQISNWKNKKAKIEDGLWYNVLCNVLLGTEMSKEDAKAMKGLEVVAKVEGESPESRMVLAVQRKVDKIKQILGSLPLSETEDLPISLAEWCSLSITSSTSSLTQLSSLTSSLTTAHAQIASLTTALNELTTLKASSETAMVEKFSRLLNQKKLKIRDQQRVLSCATVDQDKLASVEASRGGREVGESRKGKRKVGKVEDEEEESEDGFESMQVDGPVAEEKVEVADDSEAEQEQARTPERSTEGEETEDDGSADEDEEPVVPLVKEKTTRGKEKEKKKGESKDSKSLPARVELPFARKPPPKAAEPEPAPSPSGDDGEETESDDEL